jgi:hypothetical protein
MAVRRCRYDDAPHPHFTVFIRGRRSSREPPTPPDARAGRYDRADSPWLFRHSRNARLTLICGTYRWNAGRDWVMVGGVGRG